MKFKSIKDISICKSKEKKIIKEYINKDFESSTTDNFAFNFKLNDDWITFINYAHKYCLAIIDIINSTKITKNLPNSNKSEKLFYILNTMAL